ncbi:uncharacterized protein Tco_0397344 [Tanacetum coccineum]
MVEKADENIIPKLILNVVNGDGVKRNVNFRALEHDTQLDEGIDVELSLDAVMEANERTMMNAKEFYFFKFAYQGVMDVIEKGPWIIRSIPIILNKWSPNVSLTKEDLTKVPVWVKLRDVPLVGFNQDGLSAIATKVGKPIMLDSYTSTMCMESWGKTSYARAMVEISAINELKESITVATPSLVGGEKTVDTVIVEYEWRPPRCAHCKIFGHVDSNCPKQVQIAEKNTTTNLVDNERFQQVTKKFNRGLVIGSHRNLDAKQSEGIPVGKSKQRWYYRAKTTNVRVDVGTSNQNTNTSKKLNDNATTTSNNSNKYDALAGIDENIEHVEPHSNNEEQIEDVNANMDETALFMTGGKVTVGASTPSHKVFRNWQWTSNGSSCEKGTRIILGWDPNIMNLMVVNQEEQVLHCMVTSVINDMQFFVSFVYANNDYIQRRLLWKYLNTHKRFVGVHPWVIMGDFNASLCLEDSSTGSSRITISMREFKECVDSIEVIDVNQTGMRFTWNQKPNAESDEFKGVVEEGWANTILGHKMFRVVKKLRLLKKPLRKLMWSRGNLHDQVKKLRAELQIALDVNPHSNVLGMEESRILKAFNNALLDEEMFLKQKAKIEWLRVGDSNSSYFYKVIKGNINRSQIHSVEGINGGIVEGRHVASCFVQYCEGFLGCASSVDTISDPPRLFQNKISPDKARFMIRRVTDMEVKEAMFSIGKNKSPGLDGYTSTFFKHAWEIIGKEVTEVVQDFFKNGKLLTEINHTIISLLPKVHSPSKVSDYRPISCCNTIYKCIRKIISNRIKDSLQDIVSENQSAFVLGRRISDNVLLTQELMKNYHTMRGPPRCAFKVDIQKAYDTVDWSFLRAILCYFGFHIVMVDWIMKCVSTASFSINVNGVLHAYFKGKRGLRQGDPMSPYLFTLVMEVLTLMLKRNVTQDGMFQFHPKCERQEIINVCFADDLFLFAYANADFVQVICDALEEFKNCSGLVPSLPKSTVFFSNVLNCKFLVERVKIKIEDWKNKSLSFAGRVQLISSVLSSMQVYWSSIFILPKAIIKEIESLTRGFLWCQGEMKRGKAKVKWDIVCLPKEEGGLGIKRLKTWNIALMTTHIWSILSNRQSLWVKWINSYRLKDRNFWDIPVKFDSSYGWRKILQIRNVMRPFFFHVVGKGDRTSAWFDKWLDEDPLDAIIPRRDMHRGGFNADFVVRDLIRDNAWAWPAEWLGKYDILNSLNPILLNNKEDKLWWKHIDGSTQSFNVANVWNSIRPRSNKVNWRVQDSHAHLFFKCGFSACSKAKALIHIPSMENSWRSFVMAIKPIAQMRWAKVIVAKLLLVIRFISYGKKEIIGFSTRSLARWIKFLKLSSLLQD